MSGKNKLYVFTVSKNYILKHHAILCNTSSVEKSHFNNIQNPTHTRWGERETFSIHTSKATPVLKLQWLTYRCPSLVTKGNHSLRKHWNLPLMSWRWGKCAEIDRKFFWELTTISTMTNTEHNAICQEHSVMKRALSTVTLISSLPDDILYAVCLATNAGFRNLMDFILWGFVDMENIMVSNDNLHKL